MLLEIYKPSQDMNHQNSSQLKQDMELEQMGKKKSLSQTKTLNVCYNPKMSYR